MANEKVNAQIIDAVALTNLAVIGSSAAESQALMYESMAHSLALIMHNAGSTQYGAQQLSAASVARACAAMLKTAESSA